MEVHALCNSGLEIQGIESACHAARFATLCIETVADALQQPEGRM
jgi:hypothetical protein